MARPRKQGLDYFPFDVDFFSDKKIAVLKARFGINGVMLYIYLLCEIYKNGYYIKLDEDYRFIIQDELKLSKNLFDQILKFLLNRSLLKSILIKSDTFITSAAVQRRYQEAVKSRKLPVAVNEKLWVLKSEETLGCIKFTLESSKSEINSDKSEINSDKSEIYTTKKSKVKKSKEKESKERAAAPPAPARAYGYFNNVFLTAEEVAELAEKYPSEYEAKIERLSEYIAQSGKNYESHFATLLSWLKADTAKQQTGYKCTPERNTSYDIAELDKINTLDFLDASGVGFRG